MDKAQNEAVLYELIASKTWEELTQEEKNFALQFVSRQQYAHIQQVQTEGRVFFHQERSSIAPDKKLKAKLVARMKESKQTDHSWWLNILTYKIPAYRIGLSALAMTSFLYFMLKPGEPQMLPVQLVYKTIKDTVYIEKKASGKIIKLVASSLKEKKTPWSEKTQEPSFSTSPVEMHLEEQGIKIASINTSYPVGHSMTDDTALSKLLVRVF